MLGLQVQSEHSHTASLYMTCLPLLHARLSGQCWKALILLHTVLTCYATCLCQQHYSSLTHSAGKVIKDFSRQELKITSKWGPIFKGEGLTRDMRAAACREAVEGSLKRLGVDYLDMLIFRGPANDPHGTTIEQCVEGMKVSA